MEVIVGKHRRGILHARSGEHKFNLSRFQPTDEVSFFVQHYWVIEWDLREQCPYRQTVLTHPNVNLVFEKNRTRIYGVTPETSSHVLEGRGKVVGVKFKPGGFYPFWKDSVANLTGHSIPLEDVFSIDSQSLEEAVLSEKDNSKAVERVDAFLMKQLPKPDLNVQLVNEIVQLIQEDRSILKVEEAAQRAGMHVRTMQRLFERYIGISPKWIIKRYRLHEAAEAIEEEASLNWSQKSLDLGYYDQSHFIRDFKAILGCSPEEYIRELR